MVDTSLVEAVLVEHVQELERRSEHLRVFPLCPDLGERPADLTPGSNYSCNGGNPAGKYSRNRSKDGPLR